MPTTPVINAAAGLYQPGDIVEIVTGGPHMVVIDVCTDCGEVEAAYTDSDGDVVFNTFPAIALELAA
jgi:uncharacterized protein YodC (DUF2158 family)